MKKLVAISALILLPCLSQAQVVFSDNFNSNSGSTLGLNKVPAGWTVTNGTVDVIGGVPNNFGNLCSSGGAICVDLDGSTGDAGVLSRSFAGLAGTTYVATFDLAGNQRISTPDSLVVNFGTASLTQTFAQNAPWNTFSLSFIAGTSTNYSLQFSNAGGDNIGVVLDNVTVTAVPEPETYAMMFAGLGLMGTIARRRKAKQAA